jgi:hypothetical protein
MKLHSVVHYLQEPEWAWNIVFPFRVEFEVVDTTSFFVQSYSSSHGARESWGIIAKYQDLNFLLSCENFGQSVLVSLFFSVSAVDNFEKDSVNISSIWDRRLEDEFTVGLETTFKGWTESCGGLEEDKVFNWVLIFWKVPTDESGLVFWSWITGKVHPTPA